MIGLFISRASSWTSFISLEQNTETRCRTCRLELCLS